MTMHQKTIINMTSNVNIPSIHVYLLNIRIITGRNDQLTLLSQNHVKSGSSCRVFRSFRWGLQRQKTKDYTSDIQPADRWPTQAEHRFAGFLDQPNLFSEFKKICQP